MCECVHACVMRMHVRLIVLYIMYASACVQCACMHVRGCTHVRLSVHIYMSVKDECYS